MEHQATPLLWRLGRESRMFALVTVADRLRVRGIVLLPFDVGRYVGRRHQSHGVAERLELPRPMVRRGAGFNAYQAWRQFLKERQDIAALHLPPDDYSWTWNTDLAMSRPIVVTVCMLGSSKLRGLNSIRIHGTHVPVDEPSTASRAGIARRFQLLRRDAIRFSLPQAEVLDRGRQRL